METQLPDPPPPMVTKVDSPKSGPLDLIFIDLLGPLVNKLPPKWKTALGLGLLAASWLCRAFLAPKYPEYPMLATYSEWFEYASLILTGIGIYHKALLADPSKIMKG